MGPAGSGVGFLGCAFWPEQTESDILMNIATHIFQHNPFSCTPSVTATLLRTLVICLAYLCKHKVYKTQNSIVSSFDPAGLIVLHFVHPDKLWDAK